MKKSEELRQQLEALKKEVLVVVLRCGFPEFTSDPDYRELSRKQRKLENELRYWEAREVRPYCNLHCFTDVHPYEVVREVSEKCVEVRPMGHDLVKAPKEFHPGGFNGHFSDNRAQEHHYWSIKGQPTVRVRWSEAKKQWQGLGGQRFVMAAQPRYFYDYNF